MQNFDGPIEVLLAEDEDTDSFFLVNALENSSERLVVHLVRDGEQALDFLNRRGEYESCPRPHLILLDVNMPRKCGFQVLKEIKSDPQLKAIPVIMISGSRSEDDIVRSYKNFASAYVSKSKTLDDMQSLVKSLEHFWFQQAHLPQKC